MDSDCETLTRRLGYVDMLHGGETDTAAMDTLHNWIGLDLERDVD